MEHSVLIQERHGQMFVIKRLILTFLFLLMAQNAFAANTLWIRSDGGDSSRCTGLADAPDPGSGTNQACSLRHPNFVFPPAGKITTRAAANGDTVVIKSGSFRIGCSGQANCTDVANNLAGSCSGPSCMMSIIPNNVTVVGCTTSGCGCSYDNTTKTTVCSTTRPELWGAGATGTNKDAGNAVLRVTNSSGVTIRDLVITDHDTCGGVAAACPTGVSNTAIDFGINQQGASGLYIRGVDIHGVKFTGIWGGYIGSGGVTYDMVRISGNASAGIDFSNDCGSHNCGSSTASTPFKFINHTSIKYNGCSEKYPLNGATPGTAAAIRSNSCYDQNNSPYGYGDGVGYDSSSGAITITDSEFSYNTSDGFDAKYMNGFGYSGATAVVKRSVFEGNVGACFKTFAATTMEDNVCIGNTQYYWGNPLTYNSTSITPNRGNTAIQIGYDGGTGTSSPFKFINNTVLSNFAILLDIEVYNFVTLNNPTWTIQNNNFVGGYAFTGGEATALFYAHNSDGAHWGGTSTIVFGGNLCGTTMKGSTLPVPCTGTNKNEAVSATYTGSIPLGTTTTYNTSGYWIGTGLISSLAIKSTSQAINNALTSATGADSLDYNSFNRGSLWDDGALELGSTVSGTPASCGDGTVNGSEQCDGNTTTCSSLGFTSGTATCNPNCTWNTSSCVTNLCGNGNIDSGEQCDGSNIGTATCLSQGYSGAGLPGCSSCTLTQGTCTNTTPEVCGDGTKTASEQCDDGNTTNGDLCGQNCEIEVPPYQLFFTYTDGDSATYIDTHTNYAQIFSMNRTANAYLRKDFGASYFTGDFAHDFTVRVDSCTDNGAGAGGILGVWGLSTTARTSIKDMTNNTDGAALYMYCLSGSSQFKWSLIVNGSATTYEYSDVIPTITRYIRVQRVSGTITVKIYSDANHTNLLSQSITAADSHAYRYLYAPLSYNTATTNTSASGIVSNYNLTAGTQVTPPSTSVGTEFFGCQCRGCKVQ